MKIEVNIEKKHIALILSVMIFLVGVVLVFGYSNAVSGVGHNLNEMGCWSGYSNGCDTEEGNSGDGFIDYANALGDWKVANGPLSKLYLGQATDGSDNMWLIAENIDAISSPIFQTSGGNSSMSDTGIWTKTLNINGLLTVGSDGSVWVNAYSSAKNMVVPMGLCRYDCRELSGKVFCQKFIVGTGSKDGGEIDMGSTSYFKKQNFHGMIVNCNNNF